MEHIIIIGNGIAGITAARHIRKLSDKKITVISAETPYFFSRTALMYIYMGHMKFEHTKPYEDWFWEKNNIDLVYDKVSAIDFNSKSLSMLTGISMNYDKLVLAVGSKPNKFGWVGQDLPGVQGLYSYQDLELLEKNSKDAKHAVIVGGGLIGIELAEMLSSRDITVTMLVRENSFWGNVLPPQEAELINRHIREHHIDLRLETELKEIVKGNNGKASAVITHSGEKIPCQIVGLTAGVSPHVDFLRNTSLELDRGILVDRFLQTNIEGVYALGDCAQFRDPLDRRPIEQVWYTGRMMGETVANTICGVPTPYTPGNWFNSAKFLDIEYQTYGWVYAKLQDGEADFYWEHSKGKKCMHFVFDKTSRVFKGMNTFGIRLRHSLFDQWLSDGKTIEYVLEHLKDANFDPEFYVQHEAEILQKFNIENGASIIPKKKNWKRILNLIKS